MRKAYEKLGKIELMFCSVLVIAIVILVFISIWMRFIKMPIIWSIDISQLMFAWITFVGADVAYRGDKFVGVDILVRKTPQTTQTAIKLFINIVILAVSIFLIKNGIDLTIQNFDRKFQTLTLTYAWVNSSLPVGCFFLSLTAIEKIIGNVKMLKAPKNA